MKKVGIGGAYISFVHGTEDPPLYTPVSEQLSPRWWEMVNFAVEEAGRLELKFGFHACDGFATTGGPWITPEK